MGLPDILRSLPRFRLHTDYGDIDNCTSADVDAALHEVFYDRKLAFIVLEPDRPIDNVRFLQARGLPNGFQVEMSVWTGEHWQIYLRQVAYRETLEKYFSEFMFGIVPPLDRFSPYAL